MSQHDFNIANQTFPSFRADLNNALVAAATMSAGSSAPTTPYAYQLWFDTTTGTWKVRNSGNTAWISTITTDLATGNIGIGTSSPDFKAEIVGGTNNGLHIKDAESATVFGGLFTQSTNLALVARSNHSLTLGTNDIERMRIESGGNVTIGSAADAGNALRYLDVSNANTGANAGSIIRLITSNAAGSGTATGELLKYKSGLLAIVNNEPSATANTAFYVAGAERMRILSTGGITFNGDTAQANALDDYEEGNWTPIVSSGTFTLVAAAYTKIGRIVHIHIEISLTGTRGGETFRIGGLPFTNSAWSAQPCYVQGYTAEGTQQLSAAVVGNQTTIGFIEFGNEAIGTDFTNGYMNVTATYRIQ